MPMTLLATAWLARSPIQHRDTDSISSCSLWLYGIVRGKQNKPKFPLIHPQKIGFDLSVKRTFLAESTGLAAIFDSEIATTVC
jgi:hypothetical protein